MTRVRSGRPDLPPGCRQPKAQSEPGQFAFGSWRRRPFQIPRRPLRSQPARSALGCGAWRSWLRRNSPRCSLLILTEVDTISRAAFLLSWIARQPGADRADAPAGDFRRRWRLRMLTVPDPAVAPEIRRGADDGELRRRDDDRSRVGRLPVHDLPEPVAAGRRSRCSLAVAAGLRALALRSVPHPPAHAAAGSAAAMVGAGRAVADLAARPVGRLLQQRLPVEVRALRRQLRRRLHAATDFSNPTASSPIAWRSRARRPAIPPAGVRTSS